MIDPNGVEQIVSALNNLGSNVGAGLFCVCLAMFLCAILFGK